MDTPLEWLRDGLKGDENTLPLSPRGRLGKHSTPKAGLESSAFKKSRAVFSPRDLNIAVAGRSDTQGLGER